MNTKILNEKLKLKLLKQADIQSFYSLQMPRRLFTYRRYAGMSVEAKVAYTFILNRFQLSKLNGLINDDGTAFIIFTRQELADEMQISYKKAIDCFKELSAYELIWERRCGGGSPNRIYLVKTLYDEQNIDRDCTWLLENIVREKLKLLNKEILKSTITRLDLAGERYMNDLTAYLIKVIFNS